MTSYLFDTNALVYWVKRDSEFNRDVSRLLSILLENDCSAYTMTSSLKDVYYVLCKHYMKEIDARNALWDIYSVFDLVDLDAMLVLDSLESDEPDYEDGIIRAAANALQVDAIISYDEKAFRKSKIPKMTAKEVLEAFHTH